MSPLVPVSPFSPFPNNIPASGVHFSPFEINSLLDDGRTSSDLDARKTAYDAVQAKLACEGPVAHIAYSNLSTAVNNTVSGFVINPNRRLSTLKTIELTD